MDFQIGLENGDENRSIAWVLGHPGCFAYGADPADALAAAHQAVVDYDGWIKQHNHGESWLHTSSVQIHQVENWDVYTINEEFDRVDQGYSVNAWFLHDWKPLTSEEIDLGLKLLSWSREDLLNTARGLSREVMDRTYPGERWSIEGILRHVAGAEWWYLDRLGLAFPRAVLHDNTFERLEKVRRCTCETLPRLAGINMVKGTDGEFWSPRKLLRRTLWHERDHNQHIQKLINRH